MALIDQLITEQITIIESEPEDQKDLRFCQLLDKIYRKMDVARIGTLDWFDAEGKLWTLTALEDRVKLQNHSDEAVFIYIFGEEVNIRIQVPMGANKLMALDKAVHIIETLLEE